MMLVFACNARTTNLPGPDASQTYHLDGHHMVLAAESRDTNLAATGAGGSVGITMPGNFEESHARWTCLCGLSHPSWPHITWNCPSTLHLREHLALPVDRAEERLFAKGCPLPRHFLILRPSMIKALVLTMRNHDVLYLASDGSEDKTIGSFAVTVSPGEYTCAAGNGDEDQSSFKQELLAFSLAAKALDRAVQLCAWRGRVCCILCVFPGTGLSRRPSCCFDWPDLFGCHLPPLLGSLAWQEKLMVGPAWHVQRPSTFAQCQG